MSSSPLGVDSHVPTARTARFLALVLCCVANAAVLHAAQDAPADRVCKLCHAQVATAFGAKDALAHTRIACVDCHTALSKFDASEGEHATPLAKPTCSVCHASEERAHGASIHAAKQVACAQCHAPHAIGRSAVAEDARAALCSGGHTAAATEWAKSVHALDPGNGRRAATCVDCHGAHDVLARTELRSRVHPLHVPDTCEACHHPDPSREHPAPAGEKVRQYESSVHGQALRKVGLVVTATCVSCHGAHGVLDPKAENAKTARKQIPATCGACHAGILATYYEGVHGADFKAGVKDVPVCTDCHTEHAVRDPALEGSSVSKALVAETCARCHADDALGARYGFASSVRRSWGSSYHGIATSFGDRDTANCASCHGFHDILPASDPRSPVNRANLDATCGGCHAGASAAFARVPVHSVIERAENPVPWWTQRIYAILVFGMIGAFVLFILADLFGRLRMKLRCGPPETVHVEPADWPDEDRLVAPGENFERMGRHGRLQHAVLIVSFSLLVLTGLPVFLHDMGWTRSLIDLQGGFHLRSLLHRGAALALILLSLWHAVVLILSPSARGWFARMMIRPRDVAEFAQDIAFDVGAFGWVARSKRLAPIVQRHPWLRFDRRPAFARYGLVEKLEYGAVLWGNVVMIATGAILWRPDWFLGWTPTWTFDVCRVVHGFEATLAFLAIIVWHMYHVHLRPGVFPMSRVWLDGKISRGELRHHHPREYLALLERRRRERAALGTLEAKEPAAKPAERRHV
ncbi:MAG: hypothetical protein HZA53_05150 [Planctomycetes bacterium]|nr:hypothetical protein [Planctomycetota bacterium]